ncbi:LPS export ABC transporter periplasmic protein LptC [Simiduia curdlanivorans]|uniref:Lipopolysaccharide export system protein LptC n=1 Tax=Simiduia curdlanivorans TaxID=1492769 RepID=A0ABV8V6R2_9GAMM|nr:LPS export ABC transporter periplasmic protein LptC [Simiduia curdlanivorans]MDN3638923.1 LPS export ABC transporter periplasmic protein LptC [Simiduia curdlanivorans]
MAILKKLLPIIIAIMVVVYLFSVDNPSSRLFDKGSAKDQQMAPAFFITNFISKQYDVSGSLSQHITGARADHFQPKGKASDQDYTLIETIEAQIFTHNTRPWHITADQGRATEKGQQVELIGNVHLWQEDPVKGITELFTDRMIYFTKRQIADTDQPVKIITPTGTTTAVGLTADMKAQTLTLKHKVRGTHAPY